jgi:hypothetical protein
MRYRVDHLRHLQNLDLLYLRHREPHQERIAFLSRHHLIHRYYQHRYLLHRLRHRQ